MPGDDGLTLCREVRAKSQIPIIFLTAMAEDTDRIIGLEMGADDYLTKPFNPRELLARIKAVMRRTQSLPPTRETVRSGENPFRQQGAGSQPPRGGGPRWRGGAVEPRGVSLAVRFLERPGIVLSRDQLLDLTSGRTAEVWDRSIDNQVSRLRRKIEDDPAQPELIKTCWGDGYQFAGKVTQVVRGDFSPNAERAVDPAHASGRGDFAGGDAGDLSRGAGQGGARSGGRGMPGPRGFGLSSGGRHFAGTTSGRRWKRWRLPSPAIGSPTQELAPAEWQRQAREHLLKPTSATGRHTSTSSLFANDPMLNRVPDKGLAGDVGRSWLCSSRFTSWICREWNGFGFSMKLSEGGWLNMVYAKPGFLMQTTLTPGYYAALVITVLIFASAAIFVARRISRPLRHLTKSVEQLGRGQELEGPAGGRAG